MEKVIDSYDDPLVWIERSFTLSLSYNEPNEYNYSTDKYYRADAKYLFASLF